MKYVYTFVTELRNGNSHRRHIVADTDLEAMQKWCQLKSVQEMSMDDVKELRITHRPVGDKQVD